MPPVQGTTWPLEPHTKAKHAILSEYLKAWFPILGKYNGKVVYIDGFAGPGCYASGEPGSPLLALSIAKDAHLSGKILFLFTEEDTKRVKNLKNEIEKISWPETFDILPPEARCFADKLSEILSDLKENNLRPAPIFAFIDPFGIKDVPFALIHELLSYERCEVFINFMVESANRWIRHPKADVRCHVHTLLGTDMTDEIINAEDRIKALRDLYEAQLKTAAKFVLSFEMRNKKDRTQYYLFFASNNRMGHIKMKESMWKIDEKGDFSFSAATYKDQSLFKDFDLNEKIRSLQSDIFDHFKGQSNVSCLSILSYVEENTIFIEKHMKEALRRGEDEAKIIVREMKSDGKKRKKGTFPNNVLIDFKGE